jgi:hypothetical protein
MPLSVAGARPPAPGSGLQAFRLLTPVSLAKAAASVTNSAAFVTHTTASVTPHGRLCNKRGRVGINRSASSYLLSSSTTTGTPLRNPMQSITSPQ